MRLSVILLILALIALIVFICCMVAAWREGKKKDSCKNCPANQCGRCECLRKEKDPCASCWEMEFKLCEGCHRRKN